MEQYAAMELKDRAEVLAEKLKVNLPAQMDEAMANQLQKLEVKPGN